MSFRILSQEAFDARQQAASQDDPRKPCNVSNYHILICGHTIRTPEVEGCGQNCVDALPASLEYAAYACPQCYQARVKHIDVEYSFKAAELSQESERRALLRQPWKIDALDTVTAQWRMQKAEAQKEFIAGRSCVAVDMVDGRVIKNLSLRNDGRPATRRNRKPASLVDRNVRRRDGDTLHNVLSGLSISNDCDLDLAETMSRWEVSHRGRGSSRERRRSRSPAKDRPSRDNRRYRERSRPRRAAKPCHATPLSSAIVPAYVTVSPELDFKSEVFDDSDWEYASRNYEHGRSIHFNASNVDIPADESAENSHKIDHPTSPEEREQNALNALSKIVENAKCQAAAKAASQPASGPAVDEAATPSAHAHTDPAMAITHDMHYLAINAPGLVEAESDSSIGPWLAKCHSQTDAEGHEQGMNQSALLSVQRRGAVDLGQAGTAVMGGQEMQEDDEEFGRIATDQGVWTRGMMGKLERCWWS